MIRPAPATVPGADPAGGQRATARRALALCLAAALALPAWAEKADRTKPINLEADRVTIDDVRQIATFEGSVILTQGTLQIRGDRMEVRQDKAGFKQGTTWGKPATFRQKRDGSDEYIEGWAERIVYDGRIDTVQMFDRARLKRGQDEVVGNYISYDSRTEFFQVTGAAGNAATGSPGGRVRAVILPKQDDKPPAAPAPLKPAEAVPAPREESAKPVQ